MKTAGSVSLSLLAKLMGNATFLTSSTTRISGIMFCARTIFDIPERPEHKQYQHYIDVPEEAKPARHGTMTVVTMGKHILQKKREPT